MIKCSMLIVTFTSILFFTSTAQNILYVNASATGTANGSNWTNAYTDVQAAINAATSGDSIFVAGGTYSKSGAFSLKEGVLVYGSFAGTETSLAQRNLGGGYNSILKQTTLIAGNTVIDNSANNLTNATVLDGFIISEGSGKDVGTGVFGAGMYNSNSSPILRNLVFTGNRPVPTGSTTHYLGGNMANINSSPVLENIVFIDPVFTPLRSSAGRTGGSGIYNQNSSPKLINVTFCDNANNLQVMDSLSSAPVISNSIFYIPSNFSSTSIPILNDATSSATITYSYSYLAISGAGNITGNTNQFKEGTSAGTDGKWMTSDDGLELATSSAAIDAGNNDSDINAGITTDITGAARIQNGTADMGAYESAPVILPVVFTSFSATISSDEKVLLQWQAANAPGGSYFIIERSPDANNWQQLSQITANASQKNYYAKDDQPLPATSYYRLKLVDVDGSITYSNEAVITINNKTRLAAFFDPATQSLNVSGIANGQFLRLIDMNGRVCTTQEANATIATMHLNDLSSAMYILQLYSNRGELQQEIKVIKN